MAINNKVKPCYICLNSFKQLVTITKSDTDKVNFMDKLQFCMTTNLILTGPMEICKLCLKQLKCSYKFKRKVLLSQEVLQTCQGDIFAAAKLKIQQKKGAKQPDESVSNVNDSIIISKSLDSPTMTSDMHISLKEEQISDSNSPTSVVVNTPDVNIKYEVDATKLKSESEMELIVRTGNSFMCNVCGLFYDKKWKLTKHFNRAHPVVRKYKCKHCSCSFKIESQLKEHMTNHTEYPCNYCGKKFFRLASMKRHARSHELPAGQKAKKTPFLCTICGKSFPYSNSVQRHMRIHSGIRLHECEICHKKFAQSTHLNVHMRTHTGEKPYICEECGEAFMLKASLQKHLISRHDIAKCRDVGQSDVNSGDKLDQANDSFQTRFILESSKGDDLSKIFLLPAS